jgi:hypothetical protein
MRIAVLTALALLYFESRASDLAVGAQGAVKEWDYVSEFHQHIVGGPPSPTLERFRRANAEVQSYLIQNPPMRDEFPALNTKCIVAPLEIGYAVIWLRAPFEPRPDEATRSKVDEIIFAALFGPERQDRAEANKPVDPTP